MRGDEWPNKELVMSDKKTGSWWHFGGSKHKAVESRFQRQRSAGRRLGFECLEDRSLLTAAALDTTFGNSGVVLSEHSFDQQQ